MMAFDIDNMKMDLASMIEAIFVVVSEPDVAVRQFPFAMDK
jgi:hypothetical protein